MQLPTASFYTTQYLLYTYVGEQKMENKSKNTELLPSTEQLKQIQTR